MTRTKQQSTKCGPCIMVAVRKVHGKKTAAIEHAHKTKVGPNSEWLTGDYIHSWPRKTHSGARKER
jgi:hypothetical protein